MLRHIPKYLTSIDFKAKRKYTERFGEDNPFSERFGFSPDYATDILLCNCCIQSSSF
jgi:hypothetical protein